MRGLGDFSYLAVHIHPRYCLRYHLTLSTVSLFLLLPHPHYLHLVFTYVLWASRLLFVD
jgi:hypothetical protein